MITIALPKGRLLDEVSEILKTTGMNTDGLFQGRRLYEERDNVKFILVKPMDVPVYVEYGIADIGIAGRDVILERKLPVMELLDLKLGLCEMVLATPETFEYSGLEALQGRRIGTKYPNITGEFLQKHRVEADIIYLAGAVELSATPGLVDAVVDISSSGRTLKENSLVVREKVMKISSRLISNRVRYRTRFREIMDIKKSLEEALS